MSDTPNMDTVFEMLVFDAYKHRALIKAHCGRWDGERKWWRVPVRFPEEAAELYEELKRLGCKVALRRRRAA